MLKDLKKSILDESVMVIVECVLIPDSGWNGSSPPRVESSHGVNWSTAFRNATGIIR